MEKISVDICLLWGDWQIHQWWSCMSISEWASWAQAIAVISTLLAPFGRRLYKRWKSRKTAHAYARRLCDNLSHLRRVAKILRSDSYEPGEKIAEALRRFGYFPYESFNKIESISYLNTELSLELNEALSMLKWRKQLIADLLTHPSFKEMESAQYHFPRDQAEKLEITIELLENLAARINSL